MKVECDGEKLVLTIRNEGGVVQWVIDQGGRLIEEKGMLKCWICGSAMKPHHLMSVHNPLRGTAFDVAVKCSNPECSLYLTFGNPIPPDKELIDNLRKFSGKFIDWWSLSGDEEVKKRLESWGYWAVLFVISWILLLLGGSLWLTE